MTRNSAATLLVLSALCLPAAHARNLLIQGGTLIAGTDQAPLRDARILVEGNVIRRIWTGDASPQSLPPDTQVINAQGKFIIPRVDRFPCSLPSLYGGVVPGVRRHHRL
jgi:hypothetical protein